MSGFYLPSSTASTTSPSPVQSPTSRPYSPNDSSSEEDTLPYPLPLARPAFLATDFNPQDYLSTLRSRHQTLEDLRSDLRSRVQEINKELVDLVNNEYEAFISVGSTLRGGEEKIEGVRVGVLGFKREIEAVRDTIKDRGQEVQRLLDDRRATRRGMVIGRRLLDLEERVVNLEARLLGGNDDAQSRNIEEDDDSGDEDGHDTESDMLAVGRLRRQALAYLQARQMMAGISQHPFLATLEPRMSKIQHALLLDLNATLKEAKTNGTTDKNSLLGGLLAIYRDLGEGTEAIRALKKV